MRGDVSGNLAVLVGNFSASIEISRWSKGVGVYGGVGGIFSTVYATGNDFLATVGARKGKG